MILLSCFILCSPVKSQATLTLSLDEAILLAVRENPNVQTARLNQVLQKFAVDVQKWQFHPHFALGALATTTRTVTAGNLQQYNKGWTVTPTGSLLTPIGTQFTLTPTLNGAGSGGYNKSLSLQVTQPLMRGFGKPIVEAALYNAMDSEKISRLRIEETVRTTITNTINAYLDVIAAEHTLIVDQNALQRSEKSVQQTKLFIKAGKKAGVELVTVQADVANAKTQIENDRNNLQQTRYALLTAIGIDPNTSVIIKDLDITALTQRYHVPTLETAKHMILENDIQYQIDQITYEGTTKRNVAVAEDNTRWQLNFTANGMVGENKAVNPNNGINGVLNGTNQTESAMLSLTIPIDDQQAKQALSSAKIALRQADLALKQEKWSKETNAINSWNAIISTERGLSLSRNSEELQNKTYQMSYQKYQYGLIDSIELQSVQQQLITRQQALVNAQIAYLKSLVALDLYLGKTLETWDIGVRYA